MKNSDIEWIGNIPDKWGVVILSSIAKERKAKNNGLVEKNLLSLSYGKIKRKNIDTNDGLLPASFDGYNIIEEGDIVLRLTDLQNDHTSLRTGLCKEKGIITSAYTTIIPQMDYIIPSFLHYYLHSFDNCKGFYGMGAGVRQGLNWDEVRKILVLLPTINEQLKITAFLDKKLTEIDSLIVIENKQIEKLKEYKQAVITEAVTKGLDHTAPMKDSGVDWIGEIPQGWKVIKAKFIADSFEKGSGITKEDIVVDGDSPCVRYGEIYTKYNNGFSHCFTRTNIANVSVPVYFEYGDILFTCTGELVEEIGKNVVYLGKDKCLAGGDIIIMKHKQEPRFLNYAMNCTRSQMQKSYGKAKLKVVHISAYSIGSVYIALPDINTQKIIADYIDERIVEINSLLEIKQKKIDELNEYKKSLIYEYVTGKKEVV